MSPELEAAIESARDADKGPERIRGLLAIGPLFITPSDVLVWAAEQAKLSRTRDNAPCFRPDIVEERRARRIQEGRAAQRRLYSAREAQRQREAGVR